MPTKKVKCINVVGTTGITLDQIYEVTYENSWNYQLKGLSGLWTKTKFVDVTGAAIASEKKLIAKASNEIFTLKEEVKNEDWKFFRGTHEPHECVCKIPRDLCIFHR